MPRSLQVTLLGLLVAGCGLFQGSWGDRVPTVRPEAEASRPIVASGSKGITLTPISPQGAAMGKPYGYDMPHCGLLSPIDVDGSFWDLAQPINDPVAFDAQ